MSDIAKKSGISRQAVYLHFPTRAELLIAVTYYLDGIHDSEGRLKAARQATTGLERLDAYIEAWIGYLPHIYGTVNALLSMSDVDEAAKKAVDQRMYHVRDACKTTILALEKDGHLQRELGIEQATDMLWTMMSVKAWEQYSFACGWSQEECISRLKYMTRKVLVT